MSKVLITGGDGFLGKYVTAEFKKHKWQTTIWDVKSGTNLFNQDSFDYEHYDAVVHLVADLEILDVNPVTELVMNVESTIHMLELAVKSDPMPKFIFTSTADVYGEPEIYDDKLLLLSQESDTPKPFWSYAASKVAAEAYVRQYEELYGIKTVIIRPSIITGIGEWYGRFVTLSMARIRKGQPILVFGDGKQSRDFVAVEDVAKLIYLATAKKIKTPATFNAGSGRPKRINTVANMLLEICKELKIKTEPIERINPKVGELGRKPHEQKNQGLNVWYAMSTFPWKPKSDFRTLLTNELKWVMQMPDDYFEEWIKNPRY